MATKTENLGLTIDTDADDVDIDVIGANFDELDKVGLCYVIGCGTSGNWYWRRWSDGRAECWQRVSAAVRTNTVSGSIFRSSNVSFTFPQSFSSPPMVTCSPVSGSNTLWASLNSVTSTGMSMYYMSADNVTHTGAACNIHVSGMFV